MVISREKEKDVSPVGLSLDLISPCLYLYNLWRASACLWFLLWYNSSLLRSVHSRKPAQISYKLFFYRFLMNCLFIPTSFYSLTSVIFIFSAQHSSFIFPSLSTLSLSFSFFTSSLIFILSFPFLSYFFLIFFLGLYLVCSLSK